MNNDLRLDCYFLIIRYVINHTLAIRTVKWDIILSD
jgi:hypothetical protein